MNIDDDGPTPAPRLPEAIRLERYAEFVFPTYQMGGSDWDVPRQLSF